jgi:hypothetical protein
LLKNNPTPCHSEARFIGEESALLQLPQLQIPRAATPRFGMTIFWDFKLLFYPADDSVAAARCLPATALNFPSRMINSEPNRDDILFELLLLTR